MKHISILLFIILFTHILQADDTVEISFVGPESIHIKYHADTYSSPVYLAEDNYGLTIIQEVNGGGSYRYVPPLNGFYRFILGRYLSGSWVTIDTFPAYDFQGDELSGYMFFDETINQESPALGNGGNSVTVPVGINLSLQECELDYHSFMISGSVEITKNVTYASSGLPKARYYLYRPQTLANCVHGEFNFYAGSGGSSFTGGSNTTLNLYDTMDITDGKFITLNCRDNADVAANDCTFLGCSVTSNAMFTVNNCRFDDTYPSVVLRDAAKFTSTGGYIYHLDANAPDGTCTMTGTTNKSFNVTGLNKGTFNQCKFTDLCYINIPTDADIIFEECSFLSNFSIENTDTVCTKCDFGSYVSIYTPCPAVFSECQFLYSLSLWLSTNPSADLPAIENNSFLYKHAINIVGDSSLSNMPIHIGANYFGDPSPPAMAQEYDIPDELFKYRSGSIVRSGSGFWFWNVQLEKPLLKGPDRQVVDDMPVRLWSIAKRHGQGTIPHSYGDGDTLKGRETVFIVDVGVNRHRLDNVEIRAEFDGKYYAPTRGSTVTLYRDYSHLSTKHQETAQNTLNFILPPTDEDSMGISIEYRLPGTNDFQLFCTEHINFYDSYKRKLTLNLMPIKLHVFGYSGGVPDTGKFKRDCVRTMSAKTAIPKDKIRMWHPQRPFNYYGAFGSLSLNYLLLDIGVQLASGNALFSCFNKDLAIDFTIALLDDGVLKASGVDGASLPLFRNVLFTDGDTDAMLHEMGHAFGMYIGTEPEQYDLYPKYGKLAVGFSAFVTEPVTLPGFVGDKRRLRHMPDSNLYWYVEQNIFDIMGGKPKNAASDHWPNEDTAEVFRSHFSSLLKNRSYKSVAGPVDPAMRRIYVSCKTAQIPTNSYLYTYLLPGSIDIMDITEFSDRTEAGPDPQPYVNAQYKFEGFNANGESEFLQRFFCAADVAYWDSNEYYIAGDWYRTFDIPTNVVRYHIKQTKYPYTLILDSTASGAISTEITSPAPETEISSDFSLKWKGNTSQSIMAESTVQPLRYMVWASMDDGATWQPQTYMTTATDIDLSYDEIPAGSNIMFRVISSDGFSTHSTILSGLTIMPHQPKVTITSPLLNNRGTTGTCWSLSADIYDVDGDETTNISWFSSLDGFLGAGTIMTSCYLNIGTHDIVCRAFDAAAKEGCATVTVHVTSGADYTLDTNSLWLCSTDVGPYAGPCQFIQTGTTLAVNFQMRSPGISTDISAHIRMTSPDSVTTTLATPTWSNVNAFASLYHTIDIMPEQQGTYTFTAELINLSPEDTVPGDTSCTISSTTVIPPKIAALHNSIDFGLQDESSTPTGLTVLVYNSGGSPLIFNQLAVGGPHAPAFTIDNDSLSSATLAPGTTGAVYIVFDPVIIGRNQAYLALPCNDPWHTESALDLKGDYLVPEPFGYLILPWLSVLMLRVHAGKKNGKA